MIQSELGVLGGILMRGSRIVIPDVLRKITLRLAHEGHPGIVKMKDRLRSKFWCPNMDCEAERFIRTCNPCQKLLGDSRGEMKRRKLPDGPWKDVAVDFLGPLPSGDSLFVIVDYFSRYVEVKITKSAEAKVVIVFLKETFARYGIPFTLTSDNGPQFRSKEFSDFLSEWGTLHYTIPPAWSQANSEVERQLRRH